MEGAVIVVVRILFGRLKAWSLQSYIGKKATMKMARKIRVFLRLVSKGINVRRTNADFN